MEEKTVAEMRREYHNFYYNKVKPMLKVMNERRRKSSIQVYSSLAVIIGFGICYLSGAIKVNGSFLKIPMLVGGLLLVCGILTLVFLDGITSSKSKSNNDIVAGISGEDEFKLRYMPEILKIFGDLKWKKYTSVQNEAELVAYKNLNILSFFLMGTIDDVIYGQYKGINFNILEFNTTLFSGSNFITSLMAFGLFIPFFGCGCGCISFVVLFIIGINLFGSLGFWGPFIVPAVVYGLIFIKLANMVPFQGVIIEFDMNKNFEGHTFLVENAATKRAIKVDYSKFQEVKLEDIEFCKKYKVYSDNQIEARYVLTTGFMERFKNMKTAFKAKYIRAAFKDGKITIAIHAGRDLFAMANLNKDADCETFKELFDEVLSVLELTEELKLNQKLGL